MVGWSSRDYRDVFYFFNKVMQMGSLALGCGFPCSAMSSQEGSSVGQRKEEMCSRNTVGTRGLYSCPPPHPSTSWKHSLFLIRISFGEWERHHCWTCITTLMTLVLCFTFFNLWIFIIYYEGFLSSCLLSLCPALILLLLVRTQDRAAFSIPFASSLCLVSLPCGRTVLP